MKWILRLLAGLLFVLFYFKAWRPVRVVISQKVVGGTISHISTPHTKSLQLVEDSHPTDLFLRDMNSESNSSASYRYNAPCGFFFLFSGFFTIVLFFKWRPFIGLLGFQLMTGLLATVLFILGIGYSVLMLRISDFLIYTLIPAVSLAWVPGMYAVNSDQFTVNS